MDFGGLKTFKNWAEHMFDHTTLIAEDDPHLETFKELDAITGGHDDMGVMDLRIVPGVGCEAFAELAYKQMAEFLEEMKEQNGSRYPVGKDVRLVSVEVFEHSANSAIYQG